MHDVSSKQLAEMISLLKQQLDEQRTAKQEREQMLKAMSTNRPDLLKRQEEHERSMQEMTKRHDNQRREDQEYREELLFELRQLNKVHSPMVTRLDEIATTKGR